MRVLDFGELFGNAMSGIQSWRSLELKGWQEEEDPGRSRKRSAIKRILKVSNAVMLESKSGG